MAAQKFVTGNSILLMQFRQFCGETLRLRRIVEGRSSTAVEGETAPDQGTWASTAQGLEAQGGSAMSDGADDHAAAPEVREVRQSLLAILEQQSLRTTELGGSFGYGLYREAQYVMAALADEIFLNAKWSGRAKWQLLEESLFQSHASGEIFFQKLDRLLAGGASSSPDLAMIYFQALALDFRGRYRNYDPQKQLERYRRQLYMRIFHAAPEDAPRQPVFLQAYETTMDEERRLPSPHLWWLVLGGVLTVWVLATTIAWHSLTQGIRQQVQNVQSYAQTSEKGQ